jgi:hypothetical protein
VSAAFFKRIGYRPSLQAMEFHESLARTRTNVWGIKSGKTYCGAVETVKNALAKPNQLIWHVAPKFSQLQEGERELRRVFDHLPGVLVKRTIKGEHGRAWVVSNGTVIEGKSADVPDNLRSANCDGIWVDEKAYISDAAWAIIVQRVAATNGDIWCTTTPDGFNHVWDEALLAGMTPDGAYGTWEAEDGEYFVSHYPTWAFTWVSQQHIDNARRTMPRAMFEKDYAASFLSAAQAVFRYLGDAYHRFKLERQEGARYVVGVDLAKAQDWTVWGAMNAEGVLQDMGRWTGEDWGLTISRLIRIAEDWGALLVVDSANVGSVVIDTLQKARTSKGARVRVHSVNTHDGQTKIDIVQALQKSLDDRHLRIPHPKSPWATHATEMLIKELKWYRSKLTHGGRLSYAAPKGLTDDCVIMLCLANWGRLRGFAGGGLVAAAAQVPQSTQVEPLGPRGPRAPRLRRPGVQRKVFGRGSSEGFGTGRGKFWR